MADGMPIQPVDRHAAMFAALTCDGFACPHRFRVLPGTFPIISTAAPPVMDI
jgi:hypothetical protein